MSYNTQTLWDDGERLFCRGHRGPEAQTNASVLMVRAVSSQPTAASLHRLSHEFALKNQLHDSWAAVPLDLVRDAGHTLLVLQDCGGGVLAAQVGPPMGTRAFLTLAIDIAVALGKLHDSGLVHKDIKPAHILVNCADSNVRFTGFGLASRLPRERQAPDAAETIAGTLAYMAPEQTGRTNRSVDSRSDLYSLGVTLYQMLSGVLPFAATDPMEWLHCHIARKPIPFDAALNLPGMLCQVIMKLLAKTPEERYQTATGLAHDLQHCLARWDQERSIPRFKLDEHGSRGRLSIPEKLYGRDSEVQKLIEVFDRVVLNAKPQLIVISGYSGVGKSSVVNELHRVLVPPRGIFASGKFDQYKRDIPYSTLVQAFQGLVRSLLGKSELELTHWRVELIAALEPNGRIITDLIPELKLIIGEQSAVPELEPQQAQRRFLSVLRSFIGVFATASHPLALFLDDLQWLDAATLELIEDLLLNPGLGHLMLIGAYRDNEVGPAHPLSEKLRSIRAAGVRIDEVTLQPLTISHARQIVAEALHDEIVRIAPLAQLIFDKTAGNPFFVIQFLQSLAEDALLTYHYPSRLWRWDTEHIDAKGYTDNVVDLMTGKLVRLPDETQEALRLMACLGNVAEISTLAKVLELTPANIADALWEAVRQELVIRLDGSYRFAHDRIQEAAYSLIPQELRAATHLRIGRLLVRSTPAKEQEEAIFEIAGQLNRGIALMTAQEEREQLARFNLMAGQRAKASSAYASALSYLNIGTELLNDEYWALEHELMFALQSGRAACEFLTGQLLVAEGRLALLSQHVRTTVERALVACLQMDIYLILDRSEDAVTVCLDFLAHAGVHWSPHPDETTIRVEYERIGAALGTRTIEELIDLAPMKDAVALATVEALTKLFAPALQTDANLASLTVCKAISLSLEFGNSDASCVAYANIPRIAGMYFGDYQTGFRFGHLGLALLEKRGLKRFEARTYLCFANFVKRWTTPVRECAELLSSAFAAANRTGDLPFGAFACDSTVSNGLFAGLPLAELQAECERGLAYASTVRFALVIDFMQTQLSLIQMLRGASPTFGCLDNDGFSEAATEQHLSKPSLVQAACWYWTRKLQARYLAGDHESAILARSQASQHLWTSPSFLEEVEYHFYGALALAAGCEEPGSGEYAAALAAIAEHQRNLQVWADQCPENFASRAGLVAAEVARLQGRSVDAEHLYERAIDNAQQNGLIHIEALGGELASRFYAARGLMRIARLYLHNAHYAYRRWGAEGKVRQLEGQAAYLIKEQSPEVSTATSITPVEHLDLITVLKVSQAASGEIVLERLIEMIMRTAIEQAGAQRGLLVLFHNGDRHRIAAEVTTQHELTQLQLEDTPLTASRAPESVLNHVLRSGESVVLDDAKVESSFTADEYIQQHGVRSVLCLPLMNQAKLVGALYLENNLTSGAFSPGRIAVLKLVACQAAISLENARLYREVAQREAKIRRLVDSNIIGIVVWTIAGEIADANDAFLRMVGYERADIASNALRWQDLTPPEMRQLNDQALIELLDKGCARPFEKEYIRKDGSRVPVIVGLAMFEASSDDGVAFVLDLTDRKQSEEQARDSERRYRKVQGELAHANRVATMGQLAASIAHEVSQPIAASQLSAQAALRWLANDPPDIAEANLVLGRLVADADRAADVLARIRGHIRKAPPQREQVDINASIREMVDFTRAEAAKSRVRVQTKLKDAALCINGDRVELQQVLLNLILNAFEAMNEVHSDTRHLEISTALDTATSEVLVQIKDSGPGFAAASVEQIFAAFYTTKSTGLGMGLSICRSIIEGLGGQLSAQPNQPRGAIIELRVPAVRLHDTSVAQPFSHPGHLRTH